MSVVLDKRDKLQCANVRRVAFAAVAASHMELTTEQVATRASVIADRVFKGNYHLDPSLVLKACVWLRERGVVRSRKVMRPKANKTCLLWTAVQGGGGNITWT